jgi:hypothetical protein
MTTIEYWMEALYLLPPLFSLLIIRLSCGAVGFWRWVVLITGSTLYSLVLAMLLYGMGIEHTGYALAIAWVCVGILYSIGAEVLGWFNWRYTLRTLGMVQVALPIAIGLLVTSWFRYQEYQSLPSEGRVIYLSEESIVRLDQ